VAQATASIRVDVPPPRLHAMVADVTRIPEWSPETVRTGWIGGASEARPGARFTGQNRFGWLRWSTTVEVESCVAGRELVFSTIVMGRPHTRWRFRFEPVDGGTEVTESYETVNELRQPVRAIVGLVFRRHDGWMPENLRRSLERLKAVAERPVPSA
jgi:uncharacterized protein YndB with AHSA1/START domain